MMAAAKADLMAVDLADEWAGLLVVSMAHLMVALKDNSKVDSKVDVSAAETVETTDDP